MPFSHIRPWRKDSASCSRTYRRGLLAPGRVERRRATHQDRGIEAAARPGYPGTPHAPRELRPERGERARDRGAAARWRRNRARAGGRRRGRGRAGGAARRLRYRGDAPAERLQWLQDAAPGTDPGALAHGGRAGRPPARAGGGRRHPARALPELPNRQPHRDRGLSGGRRAAAAHGRRDLPDPDARDGAAAERALGARRLQRRERRDPRRARESRAALFCSAPARRPGAGGDAARLGAPLPGLDAPRRRGQPHGAAARSARQHLCARLAAPGGEPVPAGAARGGRDLLRHHPAPARLPEPRPSRRLPGPRRELAVAAAGRPPAAPGPGPARSPTATKRTTRLGSTRSRKVEGSSRPHATYGTSKRPSTRARPGAMRAASTGIATGWEPPWISMRPWITPVSDSPPMRVTSIRSGVSTISG